ncbi:uncharacterized protein LOC108001443 [Apis cerana]|uniref:Uncharacterized protein LOC100577788 n=1 Tax=Apis mellifera TaxID=7460 RepID=A0A7M7GYK8_APIME|nr:uncharacterized protein LOC100577788 [Apis mellifera]XP_016917932.1 uncharacterized protein LOC108001443 [Apis cerana]XP_061936478.1 uncharacterized protein LOC108001443 [Apis cerana]KAG6796077.1 hypothetical protein HZU73_08717 [Apis mellifera caucasica]KAG9430340.1 hypothetical protein HZU67_07542 [Apis mellifera carnica]|eukprot:XP_006566251.1 uncharacterized protein LOC100577788 [Apis mellifera]
MRVNVNALQVLILLFVFQRGESKAIKCYQCNSKKDKDCTINTVDIRYLKPCPASQPFCRKAVYIYYFMNSREYIIIRECAKWWNSDKECYRGRYPRDSYQYVCECKNTGCNRSTRFSSKTIIFLYILCQIIIFIVGNPT